MQTEVAYRGAACPRVFHIMAIMTTLWFKRVLSQFIENLSSNGLVQQH